MNNANKKRASRESRPKRFVKLGYYLIATDTKETEGNYLRGLRNSLPEEIRNQIEIKILENIKTDKLIDEVESYAANSPQFADAWIVFDRDRVPEFDKIIHQAEAKGIQVCWSNPCIEMWFLAYYGAMKSINESTKCVEEFKKQFQRRTKQEYYKSMPDIYAKLVATGDEAKAIQLAKTRHSNAQRKYAEPSEMIGNTTLFKLVEEIRAKADRQ